MKTSLKKLRGLAFRHGENKERRDRRRFSPIDELAQASQDMEDMRDCYDSFLTASAAIANNAFEFSESIGEMGGCLLEKTALNDDEDSGKVQLMLGKVQFEIQRLLDVYRSHIFQTITVPSESLLNELQNVEEMKNQCDEKRSVYDYMITRQKEKGKGKNGEGETFSMQQIQEAYDEYDEEATLFVFRMKSLKQGQSRSLLTQAARHYVAQMCFFKKALKTLEALEPHVKSVTERQHIDYHFSGLEEDDDTEEYGDDDEDDDDSHTSQDDGELSFDYGRNDQEQIVSTSGNSMEIDMSDVTFPQVTTSEISKENHDGSYRKSFSFRDARISSQSAPLLAAVRSNPAERTKQTPLSFSRKFNTYVLPTPVDAKSSNSSKSGSLVPPPTLKANLSGQTHNLWHSTPIQPRMYEKVTRGEKVSGSLLKNEKPVLKESNKNTHPVQLPPPLNDGPLFSRFDTTTASDFKKIKRYAFSGPITSKTWPTKTNLSDGLFSGPILNNVTTHLPSSSPKFSSPTSPIVSPSLSPTASPTFVSSPKISELHELPRPPSDVIGKSPRASSMVGHSAPLGEVPKGHTRPVTSRSLASNVPSPLPVPSKAVTRSYSTPSDSFRSMEMNLSKAHEACQSSEDMTSPPLTPISLSNISLLLINSK